MVSSRSGVLTLFGGLLAWCVGAQTFAFEMSHSVRVISSRPDTVSGADTLVEINSPAIDGWVARLNGRDVTSAFRRSDISGTQLALLKGLVRGMNRLDVSPPGEDEIVTPIVAHSLSGPIFSGPHQEPFVCQTKLNGLGPARDANCTVRARIQYYYKSSQTNEDDLARRWIKSLEILLGDAAAGLTAGFKPYDEAHPPTDVAQTVTSDGRTRPYIVRREIGVINRAVYDIRFLHRPGDPLPNPWSANRAEWNGRLVYVFGGGCSPGYRQGVLRGSGTNESVLALGYAVATSTLNVPANTCNDVVSAETLSMVKEHFIKEYGSPVHTIGWGSSGGAMQLHLIAQNYPGLLDGIVPVISFPDVVSYLPLTADCPSLLRAFDGMKIPLTDDQKSAVTGFATWHTCAGFGSHIDARSCPSVVPQKRVYDPLKRPKGVRCDVYDNEVNLFGRDPDTGFALRTLDNVGVQYGLQAFEAGRIDAEQFVELNEKVGGYDVNGSFVETRSKADLEAVDRAYQSGLVLNGAGGLSATPIIDYRWYSDDLADGHDSLRSFVTRARLVKASGGAGNQVIIIDSRGVSVRETVLDLVADSNPRTSQIALREPELIGAIDRWLDRIAADRAPGALADKVARDRPSDLVDTCWTTDGRKIAAATVFGSKGPCAGIYPQYSDPRLVAGGPLSEDILKCSLKPLSAQRYAHPLSEEQMRRLTAVFPSGVCDYSKPGVGQQTIRGTWQHY